MHFFRATCPFELYCSFQQLLTTSRQVRSSEHPSALNAAVGRNVKCLFDGDSVFLLRP
jgi:hypothetical protein